MSIAAFKAYPAPTRPRRPIKDTYLNKYKPNGKPYERGKHGGIDVPPTVPGKKGEPVVAVSGGKVVEVGQVWGPSYGKQVLIKHTHKHADGKRHYWYTFYAHLNGIKVKAGEKVDAGDVVGFMGSTGGNFNPHLHFECHTSGSWRVGLVNPYTRLTAIR